MLCALQNIFMVWDLEIYSGSYLHASGNNIVYGLILTGDSSRL
jgi:hypothetical protein